MNLNNIPKIKPINAVIISSSVFEMEIGFQNKIYNSTGVMF